MGLGRLDKRKVSEGETSAHLAVSGDHIFVRELKALTQWRWYSPDTRRECSDSHVGSLNASLCFPASWRGRPCLDGRFTHGFSGLDWTMTFPGAGYSFGHALE